MIKKTTMFLTSLVLSLSFTGCGNNKGNVSSSEFLLDTECTVTILNCESKKEPLDIITESFELCKEYENLLSRTISESDVSKLNASNGDAVLVSDKTAEIINISKQISELSDGFFDVSIGRLTELWDFKKGEVPSDAEIQSALKTVNYKNITLLKSFVKLENPNAKIDLGAIAKGYIGDRMKDFLVTQGVKSGIIDLGGNIITIGQKNEGQNFIIGVKIPYSDKNDVLKKIEVSDLSVVTSGIYERYFEKDGKMYHHIINPTTGHPSDTDLLSATIISKSSVMGDALSTACVLLGSEKGMEMIEKTKDVEAVFVLKDNTVILSNNLYENEKGNIQIKQQ